MSRSLKASVSARIVVVAPSAGVTFALQRGKAGKGEPVSALLATRGDLNFNFEFEVLVAREGLQFFGPFVQGPRGARFVYITSGTLAGDAGAMWTRRAKISLETMTVALIEEAIEKGATLEARIAGVGKDGGPACASVPLLEGGWTLRKPATVRTRA